MESQHPTLGFSFTTICCVRHMILQRFRCDGDFCLQVSLALHPTVKVSEGNILRYVIYDIAYYDIYNFIRYNRFYTLTCFMAPTYVGQ